MLCKEILREQEDKIKTARNGLQKTHEGLLIKIYKEFLKFNKKKTNNPIKK